MKPRHVTNRTKLVGLKRRANLVRGYVQGVPPVQSNEVCVNFHLTPYKTRLLKLLVESHSYKTAADKLKTKVNTVAFHMKSIYRKLHVHSKSEAVAKALRNHLIE